MIDYIIGLAFLPVSILMFLNMFGWTHVEKIFGLPLVLIGAIGLVIVQIVNILAAHINKQFIWQSWILCIVMLWPALVYFTSTIITYSSNILAAVPDIIAAFLFVEGIYSFYIDHSST
ncbi:MAG: hypothetical protein ACP5NW_04010 [Candidatus Woesearchaeota archaeon]